MAENDSGRNAASAIDDKSGEVTRIIDDEVTTVGVVYVGTAKVNSFDKQGQAIWAIKKIIKPVTSVTLGVINWADGNSKEDNIWNNRATTVVYN